MRLPHHHHHRFFFLPPPPTAAAATSCFQNSLQWAAAPLPPCAEGPPDAAAISGCSRCTFFQQDNSESNQLALTFSSVSLYFMVMAIQCFRRKARGGNPSLLVTYACSLAPPTVRTCSRCSLLSSCTSPFVPYVPGRAPFRLSVVAAPAERGVEPRWKTKLSDLPSWFIQALLTT